MGNEGSGPATETGKEEEDKGPSSQPVALRNCFHLQRNSILEKLIKSCPVWLQFGINLEKASDILCKEPSGIFLVRKDETLKNLFLLVHFPAQKEGCDILEYKIKEEKSLTVTTAHWSKIRVVPLVSFHILVLHLEGSLLVFEDIFKLVAFYCVSRDLLPYTLRLPQAILEANSATELETISDLGIGFWNSSLHQRQGRRLLHSVKEPAYITAQAKKGKNPSQPFASGTNSCSCETELSCDEAPNVLAEVTEKSAPNAEKVKPTGEDKKELTDQQQNLSGKKPQPPIQPPIPPLRKKKFFKQSSSTTSFSLEHKDTEESEAQQENKQRVEKTCSISKKKSKSGPKLVSISDSERSSDSLHCPVGNARAQMSASEPDSYSTSSTEDEFELMTSPTVKKTHSMMLGRAKHRLSMVSLSNVFTAFLSSDRKLQKKIVELAQDKDSYFGNLVQDYKVYSLEMMAKQISSTEMLQEIRLMMTQLKNYLIQSTELKSLMDQTVHTDEKLEVIIESALHKCVLKPLKVPIDTYLREIHNKDGSFKLLKENQEVIQNTTTTDLGVTTSVPESALLERILHKFTTMTKTYSPEKKISILLKSCKLIYDSMTQGNPGKPHGADDFLPVLMYVLARSNLAEMILNVEYMMELMDPALQLGEGSYYLITTYGAVELIKSYDKIAVTRQLSTEVQDSIHRWERRRTLNKARASRSSVQDFIAISFMAADAETRTLAYRTDSTTHQLIQQCAEKFEVLKPQDYGLFVQVDNKTMQMDDDALPHQIKSHLLNKEPRLTFYFIYKQLGGEESPVPVIKDTDAL
ncbi:ras and Rab interactor 3 [Crotalus adamanteus]|uniref:Ras and Rab interactor 3 n=1 Tax=Crotalus adamanteus TaxID=8729 RepID=A0AAW1C4T5_CROAD